MPESQHELDGGGGGGGGGSPAPLPPPPSTKTRDVVHYQQRSHWDCGVSCVLMCVDASTRQNILDNFKQIVQEEGFETSTWTIDLCYLLLRANIPIKYNTITLGVDPDYSKQEFYTSIMKKDSQRVTDRFEGASSKGIAVTKQSTDITDIVHHVANSGLAIVLTDSNLLRCETCNYYSMTCISGLEANCMNWCGVGGGSKSKRRSYAGHYVAVVGYDLTQERVIYRNPSLSDRICCMSFKDFEEARTAYGTDEDVIFVFNDDVTTKQQ